MILSGKELSAIVKKEVAEGSLKFLQKCGRKPCLAVVIAGDNPASLTYVKNKKKACDEVGIDHIDIEYDSKVSQQEVLDCVQKLNNNPNVDGILVQLPLPAQIDDMTIVNSILPQKDVDGFTPSNIGRLLLGERSLVACTPKGILRLLDYYNISTDGKDVCIIGRSNIVGKPMAALLMQKDRNATVTICHSFTKDIIPYVKRADILICAVGHVNVVTADMIKEGAVVIDVGMNRVPDSTKKNGFRLVGDVEYQKTEKKVSAITPVPGGVGPMTIAMLLENTLTAALLQKNLNAEDFGVRI